ncbi:TonB-dependent receptor [Acetobacter malorum]|uniref:TonB-dependent receptor n=1 Tax=Acetobacter malorum TaxID=178901 RepID=A0A177GCI1_9PROT|nr:hypothetical protein [Acetobacter malorum]OAG77471.1 TonB-dependent receptor [Acetobacter malorum]
MSRQKICTVAGPSNALLRSIRRKRHLMAATVLGAFVLGESASAQTVSSPSTTGRSNGAVAPANAGKGKAVPARKQGRQTQGGRP